MTKQTELLREAVELLRKGSDDHCMGCDCGVSLNYFEEIRAFLAKIDAAESVAEGFVMVPATPSNAMLDAGFDAQPEAGRDSLLCAWEAMLAASGRQDGAR